MPKDTYLCVLFLTFKHRIAMRKTLFNLSLGFALTLGVFSFVGCGGGSGTDTPASTEPAATETPAAPMDTTTAPAAAPADTTKH